MAQQFRRKDTIMKWELESKSLVESAIFLNGSSCSHEITVRDSRREREPTC